MIEWFEALSVAGKVFVCVAVPSTLVLVIQTVMTFFGFGDGDGDSLLGLAEAVRDRASEPARRAACGMHGVRPCGSTISRRS